MRVYDARSWNPILWKRNYRALRHFEQEIAEQLARAFLFGQDS